MIKEMKFIIYFHDKELFKVWLLKIFLSILYEITFFITITLIKASFDQ